MFGTILLYIFFLLIGFGLQFFIRWSPWLNQIISFIAILLLPPDWSLGLVGGSWIASAFFTFNPEQVRQYDAIPALNWWKVVFSSLWIFSGFLLTLLLIWKLKIMGDFQVIQREILAWAFFIMVEICLFKVLARLSPGMYRIPLGYGIGLLNFLLLLYWLYPLGISYVLLILVTIIIINPLLLLIVDKPVAPAEDPIFRRR